MKPLSHQSKLKALDVVQRLEFFDGMSKFDLATLTNTEQLFFHVSKGEKIMAAGEPDDQSFYLMLSGTLDVYDRKNNFIREMKGGSFLGEIGFILKEARTATVVAHEDCILMRITQEKMYRLPPGMKDKIKDKIIEGLAARVLSLNKTCSLLYDKMRKS